MKHILLAMSLTFLMIQKVNASNIRPLEEDAFSTQEKADEAATIINSNFSELFNTKVAVSDSPVGAPNYFVSDLLNPEQGDYNIMAIRENADDLWRGKVEASGGQGTRSYDLVDLLDPESIGIINNIFWELDDKKQDF